MISFRRLLTLMLLLAGVFGWHRAPAVSPTTGGALPVVKAGPVHPGMPGPAPECQAIRATTKAGNRGWAGLCVLADGSSKLMCCFTTRANANAAMARYRANWPSSGR